MRVRRVVVLGLLAASVAGCSSLRGRLDDGRYVSPDRGWSVESPRIQPPPGYAPVDADHGKQGEVVVFPAGMGAFRSLHGRRIRNEERARLAEEGREAWLRSRFREAVAQTMPPARWTKDVYVPDALGGAIYSELRIPGGSGITHFSSGGGGTQETMVDAARGVALWVQGRYLFTAQFADPVMLDDPRQVPEPVTGDELRSRALAWMATVRVKDWAEVQ